MADKIPRTFLNNYDSNSLIIDKENFRTFIRNNQL